MTGRAVHLIYSFLFLVAGRKEWHHCLIKGLPTYDTCSNGSGRLCTLTDSSGSTYYQYDSQGRVTRKDQVIGMTALTQRYTYSSDGKLQTETLPSGAVIGYSYNQDQFSALSINGQTYLSGLRYNAAQQITRWQWADGSANQQVYDNLNRLQRFQLGKDTRTSSYVTFITSE